MKRFLRSLFIHAFAIWIISENVGGIDYSGDFKILFLGAAALTVTDSFLKPIINLLLLPFNLVTLGVFRWVSSVITLYIATLLVTGFSVVSFVYPGLASNYFIIPSFSLSVFWAYILISFLISVSTSLLFWVAH